MTDRERDRDPRGKAGATPGSANPGLVALTTPGRELLPLIRVALDEVDEAAVLRSACSGKAQRARLAEPNRALGVRCSLWHVPPPTPILQPVVGGGGQRDEPPSRFASAASRSLYAVSSASPSRSARRSCRTDSALSVRNHCRATVRASTRLGSSPMAHATPPP